MANKGERRNKDHKGERKKRRHKNIGEPKQQGKKRGDRKTRGNKWKQG